MENLDTGTLLSNYCKKHRIYKSALARKMNVSYQSIFYFFKTKSIDTNKLVEFCYGLQHNFLMDLAHQLPDTYTTDITTNTSKDEEIAKLKEEIKILQAEKNLLERMLMK